MSEPAQRLVELATARPTWSLGLIPAGLAIIGTVPLDADLSSGHMALMGGALALAVAIS